VSALGVSGRLARACFALAVLGSFVVLFAPGSDVPASPPGVDKVVHASLFAVLAFTGLWAGIRSRWFGLALVVYAGVSELIQMVPALRRDASFGDYAADVAGVLLGFLLWIAVARRRARSR
jgi:hypothetical protein